MYNVDKIGLNLGDRVRWESAEGTLRGEVVGMSLAKNAAGKVIPWITVEYIRNNRNVQTILCGTEGYLKMMKFTVIFRDKNNLFAA